MFRQKRWVALIVFMLALYTLNNMAFHAAKTEPEKALMQIFKIHNDDAHYSDAIFYLTGEPHSRDYSHLFTPALKQAVSKMERDLVRQNCGGKYIEGELCGLEYDPISCSQDPAGAYLYRTKTQSKDSATIAAVGVYPPDTPTLAFHFKASTYRLAHVDGRWKLDGVRCQGADAFNMDRP